MHCVTSWPCAPILLGKHTLFDMKLDGKMKHNIKVLYHEFGGKPTCVLIF